MRRCWTPKEEDVTIVIAELGTSQPVVRILKLLMEGNVGLGELRCQRIGILNADECIPRCPMVSDGIGQGQYIACYGLQEDPRLVPPDNCKEWILRAGALYRTSNPALT